MVLSGDDAAKSDSALWWLRAHPEMHCTSGRGLRCEEFGENKAGGEFVVALPETARPGEDNDGGREACWMEKGESGRRTVRGSSLVRVGRSCLINPLPALPPSLTTSMCMDL
eukprot:3556986-Rhodomonas_salina.2